MKVANHTNRVAGFSGELDTLFNHLLGGQSPAERTQSLRPTVTVTESETQYSLVLELPGVAPEDVSIEMTDGRLSIEGEKKSWELSEGESVVRSNRREGPFSLAYDFAASVDSEKITADFSDGLLTLVLPKSAKVLPRKIEIGAGKN